MNEWMNQSINRSSKSYNSEKGKQKQKAAGTVVYQYYYDEEI